MKKRHVSCQIRARFGRTQKYRTEVTMHQLDDNTKILVQADVSEFFYSQLARAVESQNVDISEGVQFYLTNLLKTHAFPSCPMVLDGMDLSETPLALVFAKAMSSELEQKIQLLRHLGDRSLYVSGFFADSLKRELVDIDYYIHMGCNAFSSLSGLARFSRRAEVFRAVFEELAEKFRLLVDLLTTISEECSLHDAKDVLRLYETWLRTRSGRLAKKLEEQGIVPDHSIAINYLQ